MLTNITLENFKAFQKLDNLKIKPITILCGTNSCGKSSILQSILLMKQTLESTNPKQNLLLNGRFVKLGYFKDIIFRKQKDAEITLSLEFKNGSFNTFEYGVLGGNAHTTTSHAPFDHNYITHIELKLSNFLQDNNYQLSSLIIKLSSHWDDITKSENLGEIQILHIKGDKYNIKWRNVRIDNSYIGEFTESINFSNLFTFKISFPKELTAEERINRFQPYVNLFLVLKAVNDVLKDIYAKYSYIGPLRGEPEREYIYRDEVVEIGNKGENAAFLYLSERDNLLKNQYFFNSTKNTFDKKEQILLKDALNEWLTLMKIENFDAEIINRIIYLSQNASKYDTTKVGIADVGFGVSQIFPIILEGLRMDTESTLLLEQPEIHLHPNLQMQMADYFIALALSGKNVMAETHSDHIVNRLVRRIVEDDTLNLKNLVCIYFIKPSENGAIYEEINIDDTKGITNWPADFFDQTTTESLKIIQAGLQKRKNRKNKTV